MASSTALTGQPAPPDDALSSAFAALGSPTRLAILRQLQTPRILSEIRVEAEGAGADGKARPISRQAVREHLARLMENRLVSAREAERGGRPTVEYLLNHRTLFAFAEEMRGLARMRPAVDPPGATVRRATPAPGEAAEGPRLVLVKGLEEGRTFPLGPPGRERREWVIGRRRGAEVPLDFDPFVSSENAVVVREDGGHFVQDLPDSRNGTTVNFQLLDPGARRALRTGDVVGVGRTLLLFRE